MICYLDSSVVLRKVFGEPRPLPEWKKIRRGFSSSLLRTECLRTVDRLRLTTPISHEETTRRLMALREVFSHIGLLSLTEKVQERAEQPFSTPLGTLDGLHLATALLWRETHGDDFILATHDTVLAMAARAHGLAVMGVY